MAVPINIDVSRKEFEQIQKAREMKQLGLAGPKALSPPPGSDKNAYKFLSSDEEIKVLMATIRRNRSQAGQ